jgi:hypothetical protein
MMQYQHQQNTTNASTTHHPYNSSCNYCHHSDSHHQYTYGEDSISSSPPYETCYYNPFHSSKPVEAEPYRYSYLLNLITAPDMTAYLSVAGFTDDIYALPLHLQRLISEAREEIVFATTEKSAQLRLERVRKLVWLRSDGDFFNLMNQLNELISDEEELEDLLRI